MAGQQPASPRQPDIVTTSQAGTISEKSGSCRPAIWLSAISSRPEILASVMIGVPSAPKATGEVLANSASPAAYRGEKPRPINSAAEMATGVPKPAAPSTKRAEAKGDQECLHPPVGRDGGDRLLDDVELAGADGEMKQEHGGQHDPTDRQQAEAGAVWRPPPAPRRAGMPKPAIATSRAAARPTIAAPRRRLADDQQAQQHHDRRGGQQRRQPRRAERIVNLHPLQDVGLPWAKLLGVRRILPLFDPAFGC